MTRAFLECGRRSFARLSVHAYPPHAFRVVYCLALGLSLLSCGSPPPAPGEIAPGEASTLLPRYVLVFIIHGDGGYLYHDTDGNKFRADEEALAGAIRVAERNSRAEVFIFHEKKKKRTLFLFPRRDGEFYYYRNGQLLGQESYWRDQGESRFDPEMDLYDRFRAEAGPETMRFFLYFGHEIPEFDGTGYDASYRDRPFTVPDLADGLKRITRDSTKFDFVVLSTCFNGTPYTISALSPYARYILASPGNLHLSYFDLRPFEQLNVGSRDEDVSAFAKVCAHQSFGRLEKDIQTEISIAVYDVVRVQEYLNSVGHVYDDDLITMEYEAPRSVEHCDCADDSLYLRPAMSAGVEVFFRPARFGRASRKPTHSGWECYKFPK